MVKKRYKFLEEHYRDFYTTEQLAVIFGRRKRDINDMRALGMFVNTPPKTRITGDTLFKVHNGELITVYEVVQMYKEQLLYERSDGCLEFPKGCRSNICLSAGFIATCPAKEKMNNKKSKYRFAGRVYYQANHKRLYLLRHLRNSNTQTRGWH